MIERPMGIHRLALAVAACAVVFVGCTNESYYCDDTGCYSCDGVGCRAVPPPTRTPGCRGDFECAAGSHCTSNLGCVQGCTATSECPHGTECTGGMCVAPTEHPVPNPGACTSNADCASADLECVNGVCEHRTGPPACDAGGTCPTGQLCVDSQCREQTNVCHFDSECGMGRTCVNQTCTEGCTTDATCATGATCVAGLCTPVVPPTGVCTTNAMCPTGQICVDTSCVVGCSADSECATGQYCNAGQCAVDDRPHPDCTNDGMCAAGSVCRNGACRSPCSMSSECPRFDVSLTVCLDMVCATTNEATSDCSAQSDCHAGQSCVDGICR